MTGPHLEHLSRGKVHCKVLAILLTWYDYSPSKVLATPALTIPVLQQIILQPTTLRVQNKPSLLPAFHNISELVQLALKSSPVLCICAWLDILTHLIQLLYTK